MTHAILFTAHLRRGARELTYQRTPAGARCHSKRRTGGFTLVEVLVSLVVLSMGLLGIAKLVMFSSRANDSAYLRGQATAQAYAMLDSLRANRLTATGQGYDTALTAVPSNPGSCLGTAACSAGNLALYDVYTWKTRLAAALPAGAGSITTSTTTPTTAVIVVQWNDAVAQSTFGASADGVAAPLSVTLQTVL